jgi:hypothetical protein
MKKVYEKLTKEQKKLAKESVSFEDFVKNYRKVFPKSARLEKALSSIFYRVNKGGKKVSALQKVPTVQNPVQHKVMKSHKELDPKELSFLT